MEDASDILVKQIKPNFKVLGPRFGKDMRVVATAIQNLDSNGIKEIEKQVGVQVSQFSVGPDRKQTININKLF